MVDFGADKTGVADSTAAIQRTIDAADASGQAVYLPTGVYRITDTLKVSTASNSSGQAHVSIVGDGIDRSRLLYWGPADRETIRMSATNNCQYRGFSLMNRAASKGTTTGILVTGPAATGTQNAGNIYEQVGIYGYHCGFIAGGAEDSNRAASEITYRNLVLVGNDIGWIAGPLGGNEDFNTLDHVFHMLILESNGIGLQVSNVTNISVYGGSGSQQSIADFSIGASPSLISGFRSEDGNLFLQAYAPTYQGHAKEIHVVGCYVANTSNPSGHCIETQGDPMLLVESCYLNGKVWLSYTADQHVVMANCEALEGDAGLPFVVDPAAEWQGLSYSVKSCVRADTRAPFADEEGAYINHQRVVIGGLHPLALQDQQHPDSSPPYVRLPRVRALAQGSSVEGANLRLQCKFQGSGTLVVPFVRNLTVSRITDNSQPWVPLVATTGAFNPSDIGRRAAVLAVYWAAGAFHDAIGWIASVTSPTHAAQAFFRPGNVPAQDNLILAIGENEPDANYMLMLASDSPETISWSAKSAMGFTLHSSNSASTATVDVLLVR
ncbi:MAG TPA: glycosyl hydrolase family 28-related protein [Vicinamibacterales bacterium]